MSCDNRDDLVATCCCLHGIVSTVNATARDYHGFTAFMSYARLVQSACAKNRLPADIQVPLPPRQIATATIQHYVDNLYTVLPFFEETSLYYSIDSVYRAQEDSTAYVTDFDIWSVRLILAIINALFSNQRGDKHYLEAVGHVNGAMEHAEGVLRPGSIQSVQALLFLIEYSLLDPYHFDSWSLIGMASRAMIDLGLHQDPPKGAGTPKSKLELRRRIFHCIYILDRSAAITQTRNFTFSDDSSNVMSPFSPNNAPRTGNEAHKKWLKTFHHSTDIMSLRRIQSKWYYDLFQSGRDLWSDPYPYIWQTYHSMTNWFSGISKSTNSSVRLFFELELLYSQIYILGASPRIPRPHPYAQTLLFEHCISYADILIRTIDDNKRIAPISFNDNMRAYMTGMQLLDVLVKSRDQLISGVAPEPPHLPQNSPLPPPLPPLQADPQTNVLRALGAIKSLSDALHHFSIRFGFSSWHEDFATAVEPMLIALNSRLWELSQTSSMESGIARRPTQASSSGGSIGGSMDTTSRRASHVSNSFSSLQGGGFGSIFGLNESSPPYEPPYPSASVAPTGRTTSSSNTVATLSSLSNAGNSNRTMSPPAPPSTQGNMGMRSSPPVQRHYSAGASQREDPRGQFAVWSGMGGDPALQ